MIEVKYDNADERDGGQWYEVGPAIVKCPYIADVKRANKARADAELIAEAFNVYMETGLTPRQLADRIEHLESMIRHSQE